MEVAAFFLILCFWTITVTAHENSRPQAAATSQIQLLNDLPPPKEVHINNFPINELYFTQSPNLPYVLPEIENSVAKSETIPGIVSINPTASPNFYPNYDGKVADLNSSICQCHMSSCLPTFACNSENSFDLSNDVSGARCMSNFKALRDSIEATAKFISSSNSVFKLPMTIQSSVDSISKCDSKILDSFTTPGSFDEPQPTCAQSIHTISPQFSFLNCTDSCSSYSQRPTFDFPKTLETFESPLVLYSPDLCTPPQCVKSFDKLNSDFRIVSDSCLCDSQSMLPLLDFPRYIETCQPSLLPSSENLLPVFESPIEASQSSTLSQCTIPCHFLPTVSSLSAVNLAPNIVKFDSFPFSSSSSASSLCPSPYSPTISMQPQQIIEEYIVSNTNTSSIFPMHFSYFQCTPLTTMCPQSVFDSFLTDYLILNESPNVPTTSSLPLISVKYLLPSSYYGKKSNSLSPEPLTLPSNLPKLSLETSSFPLLHKPPSSSIFDIPELLKAFPVFDNTKIKSLATPILSTYVSPNLP